MPSVKNKFDANQTRLIRRYLVWCYKNTKEQLDRIDRYFTQLEADQFVLEQLTKDADAALNHPEYKAKIDEFKKYIQVKKENVLKQKFADAKHVRLSPEYQYLKNRFRAIEKAVVYFLGKRELRDIIDLYEIEMTKRILESREH